MEKLNARTLAKLAKNTGQISKKTKTTDLKSILERAGYRNVSQAKLKAVLKLLNPQGG